jgi:hypothetical protein
MGVVVFVQTTPFAKPQGVPPERHFDAEFAWTDSIRRRTARDFSDSPRFLACCRRQPPPSGETYRITGDRL